MWPFLGISFMKGSGLLTKGNKIMKKQYVAPIFASFPLMESDIIRTSGLSVKKDNSGPKDVEMGVNWG